MRISYSINVNKLINCLKFRNNDCYTTVVDYTTHWIGGNRWIRGSGKQFSYKIR